MHLFYSCDINFSSRPRVAPGRHGGTLAPLPPPCPPSLLPRFATAGGATGEVRARPREGGGGASSSFSRRPRGGRWRSRGGRWRAAEFRRCLAPAARGAASLTAAGLPLNGVWWWPLDLGFRSASSGQCLALPSVMWRGPGWAERRWCWPGRTLAAPYFISRRLVGQWWWSSSSSKMAGQRLGDRISRSII